MISELYPYLLENVFYPFLRRDAELLREFAAFSGELDVVDDQLVFTIPALFDFTRSHYEKHAGREIASDRAGYLRFRKALYTNPTNQMLAQRDAHVELVSVASNHDQSVYRLVG